MVMIYTGTIIDLFLLTVTRSGHLPAMFDCPRRAGEKYTCGGQVKTCQPGN